MIQKSACVGYLVVAVESTKHSRRSPAVSAGLPKRRITDNNARAFPDLWAPSDPRRDARFLVVAEFLSEYSPLLLLHSLGCENAKGMDNHPLKVVLQLHLASDANAVLHLPSILASMNAEALQPSAHTQKWTTRIHSLLHSKDAAARWAGLCIALHTSVYSRALMMECAQAWITVALPILSVRIEYLLHTAISQYIQKTEPGPSMKAAIRLLRFVFAEATHFPEFQRQIATPNVPKFSAALVSLAERNEDEEVQVSRILRLLLRGTHNIPSDSDPRDVDSFNSIIPDTSPCSPLVSVKPRAALSQWLCTETNFALSLDLGFCPLLNSASYWRKGGSREPLEKICGRYTSLRLGCASKFEDYIPDCRSVAPLLYSGCN